MLWLVYGSVLTDFLYAMLRLTLRDESGFSEMLFLLKFQFNIDYRHIIYGNQPKAAYRFYHLNIMTMDSVNRILGVVILALIFTISGSSVSAQQKEKQRELFIENLLDQMTLEEKVGQMTQVTLDIVCEGKPFDNKKIQRIDEQKLAIALKNYHLGSILNIGNHTKTQDKWYELIGRIQEMATEETRLKIPVIYGIDAIHGMNYTQGGTLFPQELGLAATWQPEFARKMAAVTAYEVRASGISWNFSPVLDLARQPLWSRFFETLGEDVHLAQTMTEAIIQGYQGNDVSDPTKVAACMKHYVGYSNSKSGHDRTPIYMDERVLREYYLPTFETAIANNAQTVMVNSTEINGNPVHSDYHLLTELLKEELKFDGFVVTDWDDINKLYHTHRVAKDEKEAVKMAINAGVDMSMVPMDYSFCDYLIALVKENEVPMSRIDDAVTRILRVKYNLGLFEHALYPKSNYPGFGKAEWVDWSFQAACESITLLKNEKALLPLRKDQKVLVVGPTANSLNCLNGAWTHCWQGDETEYNSKGKSTLIESLKQLGDKSKVTFVSGAAFDSAALSDKRLSEAANVDVIIACVGEAPSTEKPGDIDNLDLSHAQLDLVKRLSVFGKPIVLVLTEARPRIVREIEPLCQSIITTYLPGDEGGRALASIVYGDVNPSGKLPFTYPKFSGNLTTYDHKYSEEHGHWDFESGFAPQWEFGHGLSYTQFEYGTVKVSDSLFANGDQIQVTVSVTNTGAVAGKEVVQLYSRDEVRSVTPPVKDLVAYEKVSLQPGETKLVTFTLDASDFSFVNNRLQRVTEPGYFELQIQGKKQRVRYTGIGELMSVKKTK